MSYEDYARGAGTNGGYLANRMLRGAPTPPTGGIAGLLPAPTAGGVAGVLPYGTPPYSYMNGAGGPIPMPQAGGSAPPIPPRTGAPVTFAEPPGRLPTGLNAWDVPQKQLPAVRPPVPAVRPPLPAVIPAVRPPVPAVRPPLPAVIPAEASPGMLSRVAGGAGELAGDALKFGAKKGLQVLNPIGDAILVGDFISEMMKPMASEDADRIRERYTPTILGGVHHSPLEDDPVRPATPTTQEALGGLEQLRASDPTATHGLWGLHNGQPAQTAQTAQVAPQFSSPDLSGLGSSLPQVPNFAPRVQQAPHRAMQAGRSAHQMGHGRPAQAPVRQQAPQFAMGPQVSVQPNVVGGYNVINSQNHLINMSDPDAVRLNQLRQAQVHQTVQQDPRLAQAVTNALNTHPSLTTINGVYQGGLPPHLRRTY